LDELFTSFCPGFIGVYSKLSVNQNVQYGNVIFRCNGDSIASNIISKIIDTNYAYYYMLEKSVSDSKNNDINVSDLSVKLTRIKNDATKI
jgi:hypothetical protein